MGIVVEASQAFCFQVGGVLSGIHVASYKQRPLRPQSAPAAQQVLVQRQQSEWNDKLRKLHGCQYNAELGSTICLFGAKHAVKHPPARRSSASARPSRPCSSLLSSRPNIGNVCVAPTGRRRDLHDCRSNARSRHKALYMTGYE